MQSSTIMAAPRTPAWLAWQDLHRATSAYSASTCHRIKAQNRTEHDATCQTRAASGSARAFEPTSLLSDLTEQNRLGNAAFGRIPPFPGRVPFTQVGEHEFLSAILHAPA